MKRLTKLLLVFLAALMCLSVPLSANAYGPSVLYSPSGNCNMVYCVTYPKTVELPNGKLLATFENDNENTNMEYFPIYTSTDNGKTWSFTSRINDQVDGWGNDNGAFLYVLPQAIGNMPAGTILCAGLASPPDHSRLRLELYKSNDDGVTWTYVSRIAEGGAYSTTPIWEPFIMVANNKLIVYYSDERDKANHNQKIVHQTSTNGVNWGAVVEDVALTNSNLRPGMPVIAKMANGQYVMTYEIVNASGLPNNFKISSNPESWNPTDAGTTIDYGGSPYIISLPNGRLAYNSFGSSDILINTNSGVGSWTPVHTNIEKGYSRTLQYVHATGRVLIMSAGGPFWKTPTQITYGDIDLGFSVGPYYKLVNRLSGKVLSIWGGSLQDGAAVVQWTDDGTADKQWHVIDLGNGYKSLINKNSGRALGIWQSGLANGDKASHWVENNNYDQQWQLVPFGSYYKIVDRNSGKLLCIYGTSTQNGADVVQWSDTGTLDQQWQLVQVQ
jgi:uncharacterized protein (DUF779 family)